MRRNKPLSAAILMVSLVFLLGGNVFAGEAEALLAPGAKETDESRWLFSFYSKYISPVDGDRCSMYPTCSRYSAEAVKKHGLLMGWIMTCDRLIRDGGDPKKSNPVLIDHKVRSYDPVGNNDFWWRNSSDADEK